MSESERVPGRPRWGWRLAGVAALLVLVFGIWRVFFVYAWRTGICFAPGDPLVRIESPAVVPPPVPAESRELVVMSWNIEGHAALINGDHLREIAEVINAQRPDLVGLQEIHRETWQSRFRDQAAELAELTGMEVYFGSSFESGRGEFGNAVLTRGRIRGGKVHPLPCIGEPRSLLQAWIEIDGQPVSFFVTHLVTWGRFNRASRREQLSCLAAHLETSPIPAVVLGDFNATPESPEIAEFSKHPAVRAASGSGATHRLTQQQLDYIFVDPRWRVRWSRVITAGPSDHWPILAGLSRDVPGGGA
ncbi:MAG TPA: endonuclease/exonuclease/phosphatase family protein [Thermoanaerobaculia bacterium]|nr:endonuclease/exonuclease/phosphatase family protein [Thermoanaerobaculia bacterium]